MIFLIAMVSNTSYLITFIRYSRVSFCCIAFGKRLILLHHDRACHRKLCIALPHEVSIYHRYIYACFVKSVYQPMLEPFRVRRIIQPFHNLKTSKVI